MNEKIHYASSWQLPPTGRQVNALTLLGVQDKDIPTTRWEARRLLYELSQIRKSKTDGTA